MGNDGRPVELEKAIERQLKNQNEIPGISRPINIKKDNCNGISSRHIWWVIFIAGAVIGALNKARRLMGEDLMLVIIAITIITGVPLTIMGAMNIFMKNSAARYSSICYGLFFTLTGALVSALIFLHIDDLLMLVLFAVGVLLIIGLRVYMWMYKPFDK